MARRRSFNVDPDHPPRAVLYVRVSALMGRGGDDFHSPDLQVAATRRVAADAGLHEVGIVEDLDVSGRTFSRQGLDKIRAMVEARQVDVIVVRDLARLGRSVGESLRFIAWLREHGVSVLSSTERFDDTSNGKFLLNQFLSLAELYSNQMSERWAEVIAHRARTGRAHGPTPPFGYVRPPRDDDGEERQPEPHPEHAEIVATAFGMYADGRMVSDIVRHITAARGTPINRAAVKRMLYNPFYIGKVRANGEVHDGRHDPIVDPAVWERVQHRLHADAVTPPHRLAPAYSLSGLVFCTHCDRPMVATSAHGIRRIVCQTRKMEHGPCTGPGSPLLHQLEDAVVAHLATATRRLRSDPAASAERTAKRARASADAKTTDRDLAQVRADMLKVHQAWRAGTTPDWIYQQDMRQLQTTEAALTARLGELRAPQMQTSTRDQLVIAERIVAMWPDLTAQERHRMLRLVVHRVRVRRAGFYREPVADRVSVEFW